MVDGYLHIGKTNIVAVGVGEVLDEIAGVDGDLGGGNGVWGSATTPAAGDPVAGAGGVGTRLEIAGIDTGAAATGDA